MTDKPLDLALHQDKDGELTVHRVNCPEVRALAEAGEPVASLFDIQRPNQLGNLKRHSCLDDL